MASNGWKEMTLREAGVSLIDCEHRTPPAAENGAGYPYVAIPQIKAGRIELTDARRISSDHFVEWTKKARPQTFDVVLSRRCNPGETAFVPFGLEFALGQNLVLLRSNGAKVHPPFLRWLVRGTDWWEQIGKFLNVGAVFDSLKCADVPHFRLPIPPLVEQKAIARILGALDDKVELNRRMNETLEGMARALFKSWFVDFDPVRAKLDGRPPPGLDPSTADLFPDHFEHTELGLVPRGWEIRGLDQIANYLNGLALQKYPPTDDSWLPVIKIAQLRKGDTEGADLASADVPQPYVIENGDVLFSWSGSLEVELWSGGRGALNQHLFKVTSEKYPKWFYFLWTRQHLPDFQQIAAAKATTMGHIQRHHLGEAKVLVPPPALVGAMDCHIAPILSSYLANAGGSRTLAALRDALLPKLLSGEIRVRAAEKLVEEVA